MTHSELQRAMVFLAREVNSMPAKADTITATQVDAAKKLAACCLALESVQDVSMLMARKHLTLAATIFCRDVYDKDWVDDLPKLLWRRVVERITPDGHIVYHKVDTMELHHDITILSMLTGGWVVWAEDEPKWVPMVTWLGVLAADNSNNSNK